jgi:hypothetical protein
MLTIARILKRTGSKTWFLIGIALALVGYWGPWVDHKTAALVLSGLDMAEFVKFLPGVRAGTEFMIRELFYLPPLAAGLCLALTGSNRLWRYPLWARAIMVTAAVTLAIIVLPPYPFIFQALGSDEFRRQFLMGAGCLAVIGGTLLYRRLPRAVVAGLLIVVSLVGAIPPLWQFFSIRSALDTVYGQPIRIGWGLWLMAAGFVIVAGAGGWILEVGRTTFPPPHAESRRGSAPRDDEGLARCWPTHLLRIEPIGGISYLHNSKRCAPRPKTHRPEEMLLS